MILKQGNVYHSTFMALHRFRHGGRELVNQAPAEEKQIYSRALGEWWLHVSIQLRHNSTCAAVMKCVDLCTDTRLTSAFRIR